MEGVIEVKTQKLRRHGNTVRPAASEEQAHPHPPFKMTQQAFDMLKWDVMFFGRMTDMSRFAHQLELGFYKNPMAM